MEILIKTKEKYNILIYIYISICLQKRGWKKLFLALHFLGYTDTCDSDFAQKNNNKKKNHNYKIIIFSFFFFLMCTSRLLGKQYTCWLSGVPLYEKKQNKKHIPLLLQPFITTTCFNKYLVRLSLKLTEVLSFLCVCQLWGQRRYNQLSCPPSCVSSQLPHCIHVTAEEREAALFKVHFCFSLGGDIGCFWLHL